MLFRTFEAEAKNGQSADFWGFFHRKAISLKAMCKVPSQSNFWFSRGI